MTKNGILVDYQYCTGCYSCEVACQAEHNLPLEQWGVKVMTNGPWPRQEARREARAVPLGACQRIVGIAR